MNTDEFVATIELNEAAGTDGGSGTVTGGDGGRGKGGLTKSDGENVTPEGRPEEALWNDNGKLSCSNFAEAIFSSPNLFPIFSRLGSQ